MQKKFILILLPAIVFPVQAYEPQTGADGKALQPMITR